MAAAGEIALAEAAVPACDAAVEKRRANRAKTTPQMTRFRDAKVCNNWLQIRINDHRNTV